MIEPRQDTRLTPEAGDNAAAIHGSRGKHFYRHQPIQQPLASLVDCAHSTLAKQFQQFHSIHQVGNGSRRGCHERLGVALGWKSQSLLE